MRYSLFSVLILTAAQALICNFLHLSYFLTLSILPVVVLCLPTRHSTTFSIVTAFAIGFAVDFISEGVLGLNVFALVPVGLARRKVCDLVFGEELVVRGEDFSIKKNGIVKVGLAVTIVQALFLILYIWADGGQVRPFGHNILRFAISLIAGLLVSAPIANMLTGEDRS